MVAGVLACCCHVNKRLNCSQSDHKQDHKPEDHVKGLPVVTSVKIHIQRIAVKHLYFGFVYLDCKLQLIGTCAVGRDGLRSWLKVFVCRRGEALPWHNALSKDIPLAPRDALCSLNNNMPLMGRRFRNDNLVLPRGATQIKERVKKES